MVKVPTLTPVLFALHTESSVCFFLWHGLGWGGMAGKGEGFSYALGRQLLGKPESH